MTGYFNAIKNFYILNNYNVYNSLGQQQKSETFNPNKRKIISPDKKRTSINKFDSINANNSVINYTNKIQPSILNNNINISTINNNNKNINLQNNSVFNDVNLSRKNIEENISRTIPSLKNLDISNADYYYNLLSMKNLNNSSMINNPNNSTFVAENDLNNTNTNITRNIINLSTNERSNSIRKPSALNLSVVKESHENEVAHEAYNYENDNANTKKNQKDYEKNKKDYFESENFYQLNKNYNNNYENYNNKDYFSGVDLTPINPKSNKNHRESMASLNLNASISNKKASIISNDGYFRNSFFHNTSNNPMLTNMKSYNNNNNNNQANEFYLFKNDLEENNNIPYLKAKSKTIYNKNNKNCTMQTLKNFSSTNLIDNKNINNNYINNTDAKTNNINANTNTEYLNMSSKKSINLAYRNSKIGNFNENFLSSSKKMSFLSFGEEQNFINEFNKNIKFIKEQSRKSSLNFLSMLKSHDLSKYRNSSFSDENDLGILKEYENNIRKSADIAFQYHTNDIISVYFHMNYLKVFEFPEGFKDGNFIEGIMTKEVKGNIEKLKEKKIIIKQKANKLLGKSINLKIRRM
jgi:hypothetical protein